MRFALSSCAMDSAAAVLWSGGEVDPEVVDPELGEPVTTRGAIKSPALCIDSQRASTMALVDCISCCSACNRFDS